MHPFSGTMRRKKIIIFFSLLMVLAIAVILIIYQVPPREPKNFGVTFSKFFAEQFGLDWKKTYENILDDLGIRNIRIPVYWPEIEPKKGEWRFNDIDWQVEKARERDVKVILAIGRKVPRWPECFEPDWVKNFSEMEKQKLILEMLARITARYKDNPAVWAWQVENEPFLPFGECPIAKGEFLDEEIAVVKKNSDKPVIVSDSGEFGLWFQAAKRADIFGSTLYRHVYSRFFGYVTYPLPPIFFRLKQGLLMLFFGEKPMVVVELQAEPWIPRPLNEIPLEEQFAHFNPERFRAILEYINGTGFDTFYFWGVEWWYWLKQNGHPEMWEMAKEAIKNAK